MRYRQPTGEIAPSAWLGGGFGFATLASIAFFANQWIGMTAAIIATASLGTAAVLCFLAAGRQHYINVGRGVGAAPTASRTPEATRPTSVETPLVNPSRKPRIECVGVRADYIHETSDGGFEAPTGHSGMRGICRAALVAFRNQPTMTTSSATAVDAHITYFDGTVQHQRIAHGCWLGEDSRGVIHWLVGDTHELVIAVGGGRSDTAAIDDTREESGDVGTAPRVLTTSPLRVFVELVITGDQDELVAAPKFEFVLDIDPELSIGQRLIEI